MHPLVDIIEFEIVAPYTLRIAFDDGAEQIVNFEPVLYGELYGPLRELALFNQVHLDEETYNLVWPNEADFDPWTLHEWPRVVDALAARAQTGRLRRSTYTGSDASRRLFSDPIHALRTTEQLTA